MGFFMALWPDSLESSWGGGGYPSQLGHKAVENAIGVTFRIGPKDLFHCLVARFSRILLAGRLGGKHPSQSGQKGVEEALGATYRIDPKGLFYGLWPNSLESSWLEGLVGSIPANRATRA
jgi:hypothetical protein